mmetsp:Transcript_98576/g.287594  ORF Transcript_98576/g.287594 Transcript_98576/m.287594 type:complete len:128 (+) Transcript_98576:319-702(+)
MFFAFNKTDGTVLFSSDNDGKVALIRQNPHVSVLLNGFEGSSAQASLFAQKPAVAITLYGEAELFTEGPTKAKYQATLQAAHPQYAGAFQGPDKVVIAVRPFEALVVNVRNCAVRVRGPFSSAPQLL